MTLAMARVPAARLFRSPRAWIGFAAWALLAIVGAILARTGGQTSGADHVMRGVFGAIVLPLLAYALTGAAIGTSGLRRGIGGLVALGAAPRPAALVTTAVAMLASSIACGLLAVVVCAIAHGPSDPPLVRDLFASLGSAAVGGAAYAAYFSAGAAIGRGTMRSVFLVLDWMVGTGAGFGALFTPRGHLQSLLGGIRCFDLPPRASSVFLVLMIVGWTALAVALGRRQAK